jgi:hypothetical protein
MQTNLATKLFSGAIINFTKPKIAVLSNVDVIFKARSQ